MKKLGKKYFKKLEKNWKNLGGGGGFGFGAFFVKFCSYVPMVSIQERYKIKSGLE